MVDALFVSSPVDLVESGCYVTKCVRGRDEKVSLSPMPDSQHAFAQTFAG